MGPTGIPTQPCLGYYIVHSRKDVSEAGMPDSHTLQPPNVRSTWRNPCLSPTPLDTRSAAVSLAEVSHSPHSPHSTVSGHASVPAPSCQTRQHRRGWHFAVAVSTQRGFLPNVGTGL